MGSDFGPINPVKGVLQALEELPGEIEVFLFGQAEKLQAAFQEAGVGDIPEQVTLVDAPQTVEMAESPTQAIKNKPESSIIKGLQSLKTGTIDSFISAGNTGATLTASVLFLGLLDGVQRPTIGAIYPFGETPAYVGDTGANLDAKPDHYVFFAEAGSIYLQKTYGIAEPRVALLNVGEEKGKGTATAQAAYEKLEAAEGIHFVGNAEGRDFRKNLADVYVCDGFVGNILMKFAESFYDIMKQDLPDDQRIANLSADNVGGLPFLGVNGNVMIGHGNSSPAAFCKMLHNSAEGLKNGLLDAFREYFSARA